MVVCAPLALKTPQMFCCPATRPVDPGRAGRRFVGGVIVGEQSLRLSNGIGRSCAGWAGKWENFTWVLLKDGESPLVLLLSVVEQAWAVGEATAPSQLQWLMHHSVYSLAVQCLEPSWDYWSCRIVNIPFPFLSVLCGSCSAVPLGSAVAMEGWCSPGSCASASTWVTAGGSENAAGHPLYQYFHCCKNSQQLQEVFTNSNCR